MKLVSISRHSNNECVYFSEGIETGYKQGDEDNTGLTLSARKTLAGPFSLPATGERAIRRQRLVEVGATDDQSEERRQGQTRV